MSTATALFSPTSAYGGTQWLNADNILIEDGSYASVTVSRSLNYPYGYTEALTPELSASDWPAALLVGMNATDTVVGVEFEVRARKSRSDVDVKMLCYLDSYYDFGEVDLSYDWTVHTFGSSDVSAIMGDMTPSHFTMQGYCALSARMSSGTGSATVQVDYVKIRLFSNDTRFSAVSFVSQTGCPLREWIYSNVIDISAPGGLSQPLSFIWYATGGSTITQVQKNNDGRWFDYLVGTFTDGDSFQLRRMILLPSLYNEGNGDVLWLHGMSLGFSTISTVPDRTPTVTPLDKVLDLPRGQRVKLKTIRIADCDSVAWNSGVVVIDDGLYGYFGLLWPFTARYVNVLNTVDAVGPSEETHDDVYSWPVYNGTEVEVWVTTPSTYDTAFAAAIAGSFAANYEVATRPNVTTPSQVFLPIVAPVAPGAIATGSMFTVTDIEESVPITFATSGGTFHQYKKSADPLWYNIGAVSVVAGDTLTLRMVVPAVGTQSCNFTAKIGSMHVNLCSGSTGVDITPDAISLTAKTDLMPGVLTYSNIITLAGITAGQPILATITPGFEMSVSAGAWTAGSASCVNGNTIQLRATTDLRPGATKTCVLTVGGTSSNWLITTRNVTTAWD
jgi:hypothetical protein